MTPSYPQIIPRPDDWRPGSPAPWATLDRHARSSIRVDAVIAALEAHGLGGPPPSEILPLDNDAEVIDGLDLGGRLRSSAVLLALFEESGQARVILTRRSGKLRNHRGEISFPGGRVDAGETATQTALREASEEVALDPESVEVMAHLRPIVTLASSSLIQPVVGVLNRRPVLVAAPDEVDRVFDVALSDLLAPGVFHEERWRRPERQGWLGSSDGSFPLWFFEIAGEMIWGATGRLLVDVLCMTLGVTIHPEP